MRRGDDELELRQLVRLHVDGPIGSNVRFYSFKQAKVAAARVDAFYFTMLLGGLRHRHAAGDRQPIRMIRDSAVLIAARQSGFDDVAQRLAAIAPRGMHLEVATIVCELRPAKLRIL